MTNRPERFMPNVNEPREHMHRGVALMREQRYEDALNEFLWCWNYEPNLVGWRASRVSFLLGYWKELAKEYPRARTALERAYKDAEAQLLSDQAHEDHRFRAASDYAALERTLESPSRVHTVVRKLLGSRSKAELSSIMLIFRPLLVAANDYAAVSAVDGNLVEAAIETMKVQRVAFNIIPQQYFDGIAEYFETALGIDDESTGRQIADAVLKEFPQQALAYQSLIRSARRVNRLDIAQDVLERGLAALPEDEHGALREAAE